MSASAATVACRRAGELAIAAVLTVAGLPGGPRSAAAEPSVGPDSIGTRIEAGVSTDITNELYYEDTFIDTTFLARRRVSTPESRYAGVLYAALTGTRGERRASYQLQNELSIGDKVQRNALRMSWRDAIASSWRLTLAPALEWRHDRTFDRDQHEWRGAIRGRVRRNLADESKGVEMGLGGDFIRTRGVGSEFVPDRNTAGASMAVDHFGLLGDEWRLEYSLTTRVFPDSSVRDHLEHGWDGRWRRPFGEGHTVAIETDGQRRQTRRVVTTSRDNFWQERAAVQGDVRASERWGVRLRLEGEALQYDLEDTTIFFNYQVARARLLVRRESDSHWSIGAGPRGEVLSSELNPGEGYQEIGGVIEFEFLGGHALWDVTPAAGWRAYDSTPPPGLTGSLHSSYAFYELNAFVDQPLLDRLRLQALTALRYEAHTDAAQDAASIYLSLQIRWQAY